MKLVPINCDDKTRSYTMEHKNIKRKTLKKASNNDPYKIIPSGMYSIISSYKRTILQSIIFFAIAFAATLSLVLFFSLELHTGWFPYILPIALLLLFGYKWITLFMLYNSFNKWVSRYRQDLKYDLTSIPQFLDTIYIKIIKMQIAHNWITFISVFYGGIFTVLLWWLKDESWGFLKFSSWIQEAFKEPTLITTILTIALLLLGVIYIYASIKRKQMTYQINAFIGNRVIPENDVIQMKATLNKSWRRAFILSLVIILIIPLITRLILKLLVKK